MLLPKLLDSLQEAGLTLRTVMLGYSKTENLEYTRPKFRPCMALSFTDHKNIFFWAELIIIESFSPTFPFRLHASQI